MLFGTLRLKLKDYLFNRRMAKQRYKKGYADCDCWDMHHWLTSTFPKMILELRDMKHGAPEEHFEEFDKLPENWKQTELEKYKKLQEKEGYEFEPDSIFTKWYIILTRIAFCLFEADSDKTMPNPYKNEYDKAFWGEDITKIKSLKQFIENHSEQTEKGYLIKTNKVDDDLDKKYWEVEKANTLYKIQMKDEALALIQKYFYNLWD